MFAGLDVGGKTTAICVVNTAGKIVWHEMADTHPDAIAARLKGKLVKVGIESGPFTPHLHRSLTAVGFPMVCMDARRAADAINSRRIKSDFALAEMLRTGWFTAVHVKSARASGCGPTSPKPTLPRKRPLKDLKAGMDASAIFEARLVGFRPPSVDHPLTRPEKYGKVGARTRGRGASWSIMITGLVAMAIPVIDRKWRRGMEVSR